jgi:hypothetical protein
LTGICGLQLTRNGDGRSLIEGRDPAEKISDVAITLKVELA